MEVATIKRTAADKIFWKAINGTNRIDEIRSVMLTRFCQSWALPMFLEIWSSICTYFHAVRF